MDNIYQNGNIKIGISNNSSIPIYLQLVKSIVKLIKEGTYKENDILPSINSLSADCGIGRETVKKAYNILRDKGYIEPSQGKGFYIKSPDKENIKKVLLLFDKLSSYKLVLYRSFTKSLEGLVDITILLHNQDVDLFSRLIEENKNKYDYYVITPNFPLDMELQQRVVELLNKIPNRKLIILDNYLHGITGNIGVVYQDFESDIYNGLQQGIDLLKKYKMINVIYTTHTGTHGSLYSQIIIKGAKRFCRDYNFELSIKDILDTNDIKAGEVYIILNGQHDTELFDILRFTRTKNLKLGKDIGVISYNESPINEFILDGLTTLSTDFVQMGQSAAEMIKTGNLSKIHNKFDLIIRETL